MQLQVVVIQRCKAEYQVDLRHSLNRTVARPGETREPVPNCQNPANYRG